VALQDFPVFYTVLIRVRVDLLMLYRIREPCALAHKCFTPGNPGEPKKSGGSGYKRLRGAYSLHQDHQHHIHTDSHPSPPRLFSAPHHQGTNKKRE